jgi:hypothetical protein
MHFKFALMDEIVVKGSRRHGVITDRKESENAPGIAVYVFLEPTLRSWQAYEDEIELYSIHDKGDASESA